MSTRNLSRDDARAKIKQLAESIDFAMLASGLRDTPFHVVPMSTKEVDDGGRIWFLSGRDSTHNRLISREAAVHLSYADPGAMSFLTVFGNASITDDRATLERLYGSSDDMWFEGVTDPNLTAIGVDPLEAHYWEPKSNKLVTLLKMAAGAVTGDEPDIVVEGNLRR